MYAIRSYYVFDCFAKAGEKVDSQFDGDLLGGVVKLTLAGERVQMEKGEKVIEPVSLTAIPYYAWNNRGTANMLIWLPDTEATTVVK